MTVHRENVVSLFESYVGCTGDNNPLEGCISAKIDREFELLLSNDVSYPSACRFRRLPRRHRGYALQTWL